MTVMLYREHFSKASQRQVISSGDIYWPVANTHGTVLGLQMYRNKNCCCTDDPYLKKTQNAKHCISENAKLYLQCTCLDAGQGGLVWCL